MRRWLVGMVSGIVMAGIVVAEDTPQRAMGLIDEGSFKEGCAMFERMAAKGDERAMLTLGMYYQYGDGIVEVDEKKALEWYLKALEKKAPDAVNNIGVLYRDATQIPRDIVLAYALFTWAIDCAEDDDQCGRATRNLEKADVWISKEQVERAKKLTPKRLTPKLLGDVSPAAHAAGAVEVEKLVPAGLLAGLPDGYTFRPADGEVAFKGTKVAAIQDDKITSFPGGLGWSGGKAPENEVKTAVSNGVFTWPEARVSIRVPRLSSGEITIARSRFQGGVEHQARFYEKGSSASFPWPLEKSPWHAAVVTTQLPEEWEGKEAEVIERVQQMQMDNLTNLPSSLYNCSMVTGSLGRSYQVVVLNRIPSVQYPKSAICLAPLREGIVTIGINRLFCADRTIVDLGLVVAKPAKIQDKEFMSFALGQMDLFMGGFTLPPQKESSGKDNASNKGQALGEVGG